MGSLIPCFSFKATWNICFVIRPFYSHLNNKYMGKGGEGQGSLKLIHSHSRDWRGSNYLFIVTTLYIQFSLV